MPIGHKFVVVVALILTSIPMSAATYTAASCSYADVNDCINSGGANTCSPGGSHTAVDNDVILVTSTSCNSAATAVSWTSTLTINVGITLNGQGAFITWPSTHNGFMTVNADSTANTIITGFTSEGAYAQASPGGPIHLNTGPGKKAFRFHDNTLISSVGGVGGSNIVEITVSGLGPGLIDHNTFYGTVTGEWIQIYGTGSGFDDSGWTGDVTPGGSNFIFLEDNTVCDGTWNGTSCSMTQRFVTGFVASYNSAAWVARHNHLYYSNFDAHTTNPSSYFGVRWVEVYDNDVTLPPSTLTCWSSLHEMRGGSGVIWGNTVNNGIGNCSTGPEMSLGPIPGSSDLDSGSWPLARQGGRGIESPTSTFNYSPYYSWGNAAILGDRNCFSLGGLCSNDSKYVQIGNTTTSTGCVSNGTSGHPANFCDGVELGSGTTGTPQTLTRCESAADVTAGCLVSYSYTPFTYPHPLIGGGSTVSCSPASIAFGAVPINTTSSTQVLTCTNNSGSTITLSGDSISGTNAADFGLTEGSTSCASGTLTNANSCSVNLTFSPTQSIGTAETASYSFPFTGASGSPITTNLSGTSGPNAISNNNVFMAATGNHTTCPAPQSGETITCLASDCLCVSHNGSAYISAIPLPLVLPNSFVTSVNGKAGAVTITTTTEVQ